MRQRLVLSLTFSFLSILQASLETVISNGYYFGGPNDLLKASDIMDDLKSSFMIRSGGKTKLKHLPYMGSLQLFEKNSYKHLCCAIIIHEEIVLTTAHCLNSPTRLFVNELSVTAGSNELFNEKEMQRFSVVSMMSHDRFKPLYGYDIALLKVNPKFPIDNKRFGIIDVFSATRKDAGLTGWLLGWGRTTKNIKNKLKQKSFDLLDNYTCQKKHRFKYLTRTELCGMHTDGQYGACDGESGCPLVQANDTTILLGLLSYGRSACKPQKPYAFTRISSFTQWIKDEMEMMIAH